MQAHMRAQMHAQVAVHPYTHPPSSLQVLEVSRRLLALQQLLGGWRTSTIPRTGSSSQSSSSAIAAAAAASAGMAGFSPPPAVSAASGMSAGSYVAGSAPGGVGVVDVVWMVQRAPRLLSADMATLMQRLVEMKVRGGAARGVGWSVASCVGAYIGDSTPHVNSKCMQAAVQMPTVV